MSSSEQVGAEATAHAATAEGRDRHSLGALILGAIGVVYGDIGTSPLYTMKEVFTEQTGVPLDHAHIIGAVSLIFWMLMLTVTVKYVLVILRADNHGEGGSLALTAMATQAVANRPRLRKSLLILGVFGATFFYGDSVITPAISVMGAVEGLEVLNPRLEPWVMPISLAVLTLLFVVQRLGTERVGRFFGPILVLWFITLAGIGIAHIASNPSILAALNPLHAASFVADRGLHLLATLGAVVLALTGAEALYADMGHFGARPIQLAWSGFVLPALALNYMGQGALLMSDHGAIDNPFFHLFSASWLAPMVIMATLAAIIASQAVISGAYSMSRQAILLGFLPRMKVIYTSAKEAGQIYMPTINWALLIGVFAAVLHFGSSSAMAAAYGIAVTLTMLITTILAYFVARNRWGLPLWIVAPVTIAFFVIDLMLVAGTGLKFMDGGWFPLALGLVLFAIMSTWNRGRQLIINAQRRSVDLLPFLQSLEREPLHRVPERIAVYTAADTNSVPLALLHNLKHNCVLHTRNVILTVEYLDTPFVESGRDLEVNQVSPSFWRMILRVGFMERIHVPRAMQRATRFGADWPEEQITYFVSRSTVVASDDNGVGMARWRDLLFATMVRNAAGVPEFFDLPDNAVVELGTRVQI